MYNLHLEVELLLGLLERDGVAVAPQQRWAVPASANRAALSEPAEMLVGHVQVSERASDGRPA